MKPIKSALLTFGSAAAGLVATTFLKDLATAFRRIDIDRQFIHTDEGPIEFAESGNGPAVLVIHGAGGGFDQGLDLGHTYLGENVRIIAPSRFGYLGTPLPGDGSPEAQADAHARVLDALQLDAVPVIGVSAGGPSAMQFCLRHPERCSALILIVPLAWAPGLTPANPTARPFAKVLGALMSSNIAFWIATKLAHSAAVTNILGVPADVYRHASLEDKRAADRVLENIFPVSRRAAGLRNEAAVASNLKRYPIEDIHVPTLIITAEDCLYGTCRSGRYMAQQIEGSKLVVFPSGGHLLLGHETEVRTQVDAFLTYSRDLQWRAASAV